MILKCADWRKDNAEKRTKCINLFVKWFGAYHFIGGEYLSFITLIMD